MVLPFVLVYLCLKTVAYGAAVDTVPPTCSHCPSDIEMKNIIDYLVRIRWTQPICSDDSGLPVTTVSNRQSGELFEVPGIYEVNYQVRDEQGNTYDGCKFRIVLEKKSCQLYEPPTNGALACNVLGSDPVCMVMCKEGYDFEFKPTEVYYCSAGDWRFFSVFPPFTATVPWPDCKSTAGPSLIQQTNPLGYLYYFDGDVNNSDVQTAIKQNFINYMTDRFVLPFFCKYSPDECNPNTVVVYGGKYEDTVPPTCSYCPSDIEVKNLTHYSIRVNWDPPICSDDSGLPVTTVSNRLSGSLFEVPGIYQVNYQARDEQGNTYDGCKFRIVLEKKSCQLYEPPTNGALACNFLGSDPVCMVMCKEGYDFEFNPSLLYFCSAGDWSFFSAFAPFTAALPWPDCKSNAVLSWLQQNRYIGDSYFFNGDVNDPNVQETIKQNFIDHMYSSRMIPIFCYDRKEECNTNTVEVYGGEVV